MGVATWPGHENGQSHIFATILAYLWERLLPFSVYSSPQFSFAINTAKFDEEWEQLGIEEFLS